MRSSFVINLTNTLKYTDSIGNILNNSDMKNVQDVKLLGEAYEDVRGPISPREDSSAGVVNLPNGKKAVLENGKVVSVTFSESDMRDGATCNVEKANEYISQGFPLTQAIAAATSFTNGDAGDEDEMMMGQHNS